MYRILSVWCFFFASIFKGHVTLSITPVAGITVAIHCTAGDCRWPTAAQYLDLTTPQEVLGVNTR